MSTRSLLEPERRQPMPQRREPSCPEAASEDELKELRERLCRLEKKNEKLEEGPATEEVGKLEDMDVTDALKKQRRKTDQWDTTFGPQVFKGIWDAPQDGGKSKWTSRATEAQKEQRVTDLLNKFRETISKMTKRLVERDEATRLLLLAVVARANILLFGPPGTAKSQACRLLASFIFDTAPGKGNCYFEAQFHQSTTVEDIFGAMSLTHLQQGRLKRNVESMLPFASVAFLDEAFKAQASLLSCLLSTLNERCFKNGDQMLKELPLWTTIVASNEVPLEAGAGALFDRLLLRTFVGYVTEENQSKLLNSDFEASDDKIAPQFSLEDIAALNQWAQDKLRKPAPEAKSSADAARGKWRRRLRHLFLLESRDQANKFVEHLSEQGRQVKVETAIKLQQSKTELPEFLGQELDKGFVLEEGWSSGAARPYTSLSAFKSAIAERSDYPMVLRFSGTQEDVGAYDLIKEFLEHVRRADEVAEQVQSNRRQSVEGGGRLSDRRFKQIGDLLRLVASTNFDAKGKPRTRIIVPDLYIMVYCCWKTKKEWDEISRWWMQRLKEELRSMEPTDREGHRPDKPEHMWLSRLVTQELKSALDESGISDAVATEFVRETQAKARANNQERIAAAEIAEREKQEEEERKDEEMRLQARLANAQQLAELREEQRKREQAKLKEETAFKLREEKLRASREEEERIQKRADQLKQLEQAENAQAQRRIQEAEQENKLMQLKMAQKQAAEEQLRIRAAKIERTNEAFDLVGKEETPENVHTLETLLAQNADINSGTRAAGDCPFTYAVFRGKTDFVKAMIKAHPSANTSFVDALGDPPLCQVCRYQKGGTALVDALLILKCSVNDANRKVGDEREGWLPIHYAAYLNDRDRASALCRHDHTCLDRKTKKGQLPAEIATNESFRTHLTNLRPRPGA